MSDQASQTEKAIDVSFGEHDVRFAITKSPRRTVFVVEASLQARVATQIGKWQLEKQAAVLAFEQLPAAPEDTVDYIVFSDSNEESLLQALRSAWPQAAIFGFWNDFYPRAACFNWGRQRKFDGPIEVMYAVVSTPRSGSTFLAELLTANQLGAPKEHVRNPLSFLAAGVGGRDRLARFVDTIAQLTARNGVAGTKIIWHLAERLRGSPSLAGAAEVIGRATNKRIVLLYRRDKVAQAISNYKAQLTNAYHIRSSTELSKYKEKQIPYSFEELMKHHAAMLDGERRLLKDLTQIKSAWPGSRVEIMTVIYEELENDIRGQLAAIVKFITGKSPELSLEARVQKLADEYTEEFSRRFREDYRAKFGHSADDASTVIERAAFELSAS